MSDGHVDRMTGLTGGIDVPAPFSESGHASSDPVRMHDADANISDADLQIPLSDAPAPARGGQPCPRGIAAIRLSIAETARLASLATQYAAGLISRARLAFALRWSFRRRRHQAAQPGGITANARILAAATG